MGKRGPKPTPTAVLKLRGSWRANLREGEPEMKNEDVPCPSWVRAEARQYWPDVCEMLAGMGVLNKRFIFSMGALVNTLAEYVYFEEQITEETQPIVNGMPNPLYGLRSKAREALKKSCADHGLTPSSMTAIRSLKPEQEKKGIERFRIG